MTKYFTGMGVLIAALALVGAAQVTNAAPPRDGVYDIAVLDISSAGAWNDEEFQGLEEAPGIAVP
jgi:hypothetical protein